MVGVLELYVAFVVLVFVALLAAVAAYDRSGRVAFERRFGTPWRRAVGAGFAAVAVVVALAVVGSVPLAPGASNVRARGIVLVFETALLVGGFVGCVVAASNAGTLARFLRRGDTATGAVTAGGVAVTGLVEPVAEPPSTPFFGTEAVCWRWRIDARNRHGPTFVSTRDTWETVRSGGDGVPFLLDDGSGTVRVDPADARLDLSAGTVREVPPDEYPGRVGTEATAHVDLGFGGDRRRYRESALAPGTEVTVVGHATPGEDGPTIAASDGAPLLVSDGMRRVVLRRYAARAAGYGVASLLATGLALRSLVASFAVPV